MPTCASTPLPSPMLCRLYHPKSQPRALQLHLIINQLQHLLPMLSRHSLQHLQSNRPQQRQLPIIHTLLRHTLPSSQYHLSNHPSRQLSLHRRSHPPQPQYPTESARHWLMIKMSSIWRCATTHTLVFISRLSSRSTPVITPRRPPHARNACVRSNLPSNATIYRQTLAQTPSRLI